MTSRDTNHLTSIDVYTDGSLKKTRKDPYS
jgi:hypothetical protein